MSCTFYLLRRRRAAKAAQSAKIAPQSDVTEDPKTNTPSSAKPQKTASQRRREAIQKKGDAE